MGRLDNDVPGMVWLQAISVPIAFRHAKSRFVSRLSLENDAAVAFLPSRDVTTR